MGEAAGRLALLLSAAVPLAPRLAAQEMADQTPGHHHMVFTAARPGTAADSARALSVVRRLRQSIARYPDLAAAESAGYRVRRPQAMEKRRGLLHLAGPRRSGPAGDFDPAAPQALLFRRGAAGDFLLAGAMFVAPEGASEADLDTSIPLSVARWHRHPDVCRGPGGEMTPRFARARTPEACGALGGRFRSQSRYMVHVMVDAGDDLAAAFPQRPTGD